MILDGSTSTSHDVPSLLMIIHRREDSMSMCPKVLPHVKKKIPI